MTIASEKQIYTPEEYLQLEEKSTEKHEYRNGEIVLMTGGTTNHNRLVLEFCTYLNFALREQNAEVFAGDVRLWIPDYREYTYPDIMVVQGQPVYQSPGTTTITNPTIIVEVLSKSTQARDRGDKFRFYRSVPEFKEYILIDQYTVLVEHFVKTSDHQWMLTEYEAKEANLSLNSVNFEISLEELYKRVNFDEEV
ncbi:Uma2 family endonuclease [Crocosphaera sp.]|uniref:Uma2 family endonuclease n=1 Tax=Crocosphaera sp. TaxID=2729996 RepID=UPI00262510A4|nr:Uma2 family endonuclease [Crocosphaera sp.]MDJ0580246.1 Uma2 family endonuclease [Crocosphaera sp.]